MHARTVDAFVYVQEEGGRREGGEREGGEKGRRRRVKEEMRRGQVTIVDWEIFV